MARTRVRIKNIDASIKAIRKVFNETKKSKKLLSEIGVFSVDRIRAFARGKQKSLVSGKPESLPKLSKSYKAVRQGAVKFRTINGNVVTFPEPDESLKTVDKEFFDPTLNRSNLVFTGKLLRSLKAFIRGDKVSIEVTENRTDGKTNKEIIGFLLKLNKGYEFLGLDNKGIQRIKRFVIDELRRQIRKR